MPAKFMLISLIHSVTERNNADYTIREAVGVIRKEDNTNMEVKVTSFFPKDDSAPRWIPIFEPGNVFLIWFNI